MSRMMVLPLVLVACGPVRIEAPEREAQRDRELPESGTEILFGADFSESVTGPLVAGTSVRVHYAPERLTQCRGVKYGNPAWGITAFYRINGGDVRNVPVILPNQELEVWLDLDEPGELEVWFSNNDAYGCNAWDSDYGANYRFEIVPETLVPGWMGNASSVISRRTCDNGSFCDDELRSLEQGFRYDTWARQRAAVAAVTFQAWAEGVTDAQRDRVWELLDARVHWSYTADLEEAGWDWVDIHDFVGNDVRYEYALRQLDPLGGNTITSPEDCPELPLRTDASGSYVEADLWIWFSVNGAVLAPSAGAWQGTFQDYIGLYAPCL